MGNVVPVRQSDAAIVAAFAARWADAVAGTSYVPLEQSEKEAQLRTLARRLLAAWTSDPFDADPARVVGISLVDAHYTNPESLSRTLAVLSDLPTAVPVDRVDAVSRLAALQGALAAGYAARLQERTLSEQEAIRAAAVTARVEAEKAARASEARFRAVFAGAAVGMGIGDIDGNIIVANPALTVMLGYSAQEMSERNVRDFMHPEDTNEVWALYAELIAGERESFQTTKRFLRSDGRGIWTQLTVSLIRNDAGAPQYQVAVIEDVTDLQRLQRQLQFQAEHDMLTGLPNRALFQQRLDRLLVDPAPGQRLGVVLLDLDGFKAINDSVGHEIGDRVLVEVADRLRAATASPQHLVARLGGDEFVVLIENTAGAQDVIAVAEGVLAAVTRPVTVARRAYSVTASAGIVERPAATADGADLMRAADITLYWAKTEGKNRWALFEPDRNDREVAQYTLLRMLPGALKRGEFRLHYQPLFSLSSGAPCGVEALLRWQHPKLGRLDPDLFIGATEETEMIIPLGLWVMKTACRQARSWNRRFQNPPFISVNVALRQCTDPRLVDHVARILHDNDLQPSQLQLELTERAVVGTDGEPIAHLQALVEMGVRIAIDDFGTGYSNLTYLRRLPVSELKLAASFIEQFRTTADTRSVDAQVIASLTSLAHAIGAGVTAEGVETQTQAQVLRAIGCDTAQGSYFCPPGSWEDVETVLGEHLSRRNAASR